MSDHRFERDVWFVFFSDPSEYPGRCDFESNMCSYTHANGDFQWVRTSGAQVVDKDYAPARDHTTNNAGGSYLLADFVGKSNNDIARFVSPIFQDTGLITLCTVMKYVGYTINTLFYSCSRKQYNSCALLWQKEASDKSPKSETLKSLDWT